MHQFIMDFEAIAQATWSASSDLSLIPPVNINSSVTGVILSTSSTFIGANSNVAVNTVPTTEETTPSMNGLSDLKYIKMDINVPLSGAKITSDNDGLLSISPLEVAPVELVGTFC
jgi:hypothetical protein